MRIEKLIIEKFGVFDSRQFGPLTGKVNLLFGSNEAGKSTLAAFIRDIIFGFPTRTNRRSSENDYDSGEIAGSGGRVVVSTAKDGELIVSRKYTGKKEGELSLLDTLGGKLPESMLESILGGMVIRHTAISTHLTWPSLPALIPEMIPCAIVFTMSARV